MHFVIWFTNTTNLRPKLQVAWRKEVDKTPGKAVLYDSTRETAINNPGEIPRATEKQSRES